jgi:NADH:ubiquinone oxidoreductase subunit F (NADH-binding)/(2Fe-2S) ferredoxin
VDLLRREAFERPVIYVGMGTCGLGAGANKTRAVLDRLVEDGLNVEIVEVGCIGLCSEEPLVDFHFPGKARLSFRRVTADKAAELVEQVMVGDTSSDLLLGQFASEQAEPWPDVPVLDEHPFFRRQNRLVLQNCGLIDPCSFDEYIARGGYQAALNLLTEHTPQEVVVMVDRSGLRGRGGGGFPTGMKWRIAAEQPGPQRYLICNADEGDPGAFMDRAVIEGDPHRLLEGMIIAAYGIGASIGYVYIRAEYPLAIKHLELAIEQAREHGILGDRVLGSGFAFDLKIKQGAGAFVCGEETALIHSIEGKRGMPRPRPPYPSVSGLFGKPTVINNVETLANLPTIATYGGDWYAGFGTPTSKGTKVFALSGRVTRTGLIEVEMGTTFRDIVFDIAGGIPNEKKYKAAQIGGPSGGCIPEQFLDTQIDYESLKEVGAIMGSGGLVVMDERTCMVDMAKFFMEFIQRESCGKCIPCREGTRRMLEILQAITRGRHKETHLDALARMEGVMQLERLAGVIQETSLCGLGQSAPNPVLSTLKYFREEYEAHVFERHCPAKACHELLTYRIEADVCKGCTLCARKCPTQAIVGSKKTPHYIVDDKCIRCGTCFETCRFGAIVIT